jgi:hypothetical protein
MKTKKCVRCLKRDAVIWGGHVLDGYRGKRRLQVVAGWCDRCKETPGFVGHVLKEMQVVK